MSAQPTIIVCITPDELVDRVASRVADLLAEEGSKNDEPMLLTCSRLCTKLGVSRASVYRWRGEGMPSVKAGDEFRYEIDAVMAWLRGRPA